MFTLVFPVDLYEFDAILQLEYSMNIIVLDDARPFVFGFRLLSFEVVGTVTVAVSSKYKRFRMRNDGNIII